MTGDRRSPDDRDAKHPRCEHGCSIDDSCSICDNEEFSPAVAAVRAAAHRDWHPNLYGDSR
jgi:hypothetical protein